MVFHYIFANGSDVMRAYLGPLSSPFCKVLAFAKSVIPLNLGLLTFVNTLTKFYFVCVSKSIPVMEDNFLSVVIYLTINILSMLATAAKMFLAEKPLLLEVNHF